MKLSVFTWSDKNADGNNDYTIGELDGYGENNLTDEDALFIVEYIVNAIKHREHITFRVDETS